MTQYTFNTRIEEITSGCRARVRLPDQVVANRKAYFGKSFPVRRYECGVWVVSRGSFTPEGKFQLGSPYAVRI